MRKILFWAVGALVFGSFAACVGSDPSSSTAAQGALNGACFSNGTCNPGLSCNAASGTCDVGGDGDTSSGDSSTTNDTGGPTTDEAGVLVCSYSTSTYPCKIVPQTTSCFGDTVVGCTASSCGPDDSVWTCYSPKQCSSGLPCCLPIAGNSLDVGTTCAEGTLGIADGGGLGASCGSATGNCPTTDYQLCQTNSDCPSGQRCNLVKVRSGTPALQEPDGPDSSIDIGACVPE